MKLLLLSILFFICGICFAQKPAAPLLRFEHIGEKEGLSNNSVNCLYKDRDGYMWFGTEDGLNRYDGTAFRVYRHNNRDSTTIAGNEIKSISGDPLGGLWIDAQCRGLTHLNTYSGKGKTLQTLRGSDTLLQTNCDVQFYRDASGNTWVRNYENLSAYDPHTGRFKVVYSEKKSGSPIYQVLADKNILWLGEDRSLLAFDTRNSTIKDYSNIFSGAAAATPLLMANDSTLLIGSYSTGLFIFNPATGKINHLFKDLVIWSAARVDLNGHKQVWICTDRGLRIIDAGTDLFSATESSFTEYRNSATNPNSLSSDMLTGILQDDNGMIWLSTGNGIDKLNPAYLIFEKKEFSGTKNNMVARYDAVNMHINRDKNGASKYWFSYWYNGGLVETDDHFNVLNYFTFKHPNDKTSVANISNVFASRTGNLWVATWDGLWEYDPVQEKLLRNFKLNDRDSTAPKYSLFDYGTEDASGDVWIGTYNEDLHVLNPNTGTWKIYTSGTGKLQARENRSDFLFTDSKQRVWSGDVSFYDPAKNIFTKPPSDGEASCIIEDKEKQIWLGTENGVAKYDDEKNNFVFYGVAEGLAGADVRSLLADADDNIWASTGNGLSFIDKKSNTIRNFTISDGLPYDQLGHILKLLPDGNILLNYVTQNNSGFISFDPKKLLGRKQDIPFHFTFFNIAGKLIDLQQSPDSLRSIDLYYRDNVLTVGFSALAFTDNINLHYRYRLNENQQWTDPGKENSITLTGLRSGSFNLCVQATDNNGRWMEKKLCLKIIVHPPFWSTWWFTGLIILLAALTCAFFVWRRIKNIKAAGALKQQISELELKALKAQMNPHFVFNSLTSIQDSIVHGKTEAASKYLGKFSRLIRAILENSEKKYITLEQEIDYLRLYLDLESFRFDDLSFEISTEKIPDTSFIKIPAMLIQPFVENAIKHGLGHKEGPKKVTISFKEYNDDMLEVKVEDNGIGRERAALINRSRSSSHQSMGMKITEERLRLQHEQNKPEINITDCRDENGKASGTCVIIYISTEKPA